MDAQNSQIRLPLMKPKDRIMIRAQTMGHPFSACGLMEEAAQRSPIHRRSRVDPKPDNPTRALVHHDEDPMRFESKGLTPKEIYTPQTIFCLTNEGKPGGPTIPLWAKVRYENSPDHVFIEREGKSFGYVFSNFGAPKVGIAPFHLQHQLYQFAGRAFRAWLLSVQ
jgi:hypothetical protein